MNKHVNFTAGDLSKKGFSGKLLLNIFMLKFLAITKYHKVCEEDLGWSVFT